MNFVQKLSQLTNADIASSDDLTGNENLGGDWVLENHQGNIESNDLSNLNYLDLLAISVSTIASDAGLSTPINYTSDASGNLYYAVAISGNVSGGVGTKDFNIYKYNLSTTSWSLLTTVNAGANLDQNNNYYRDIGLAVDSNNVLHVAITEMGTSSDNVSNIKAVDKGVYYSTYNINTSTWGNFSAVTTQNVPAMGTWTALANQYLNPKIVLDNANNPTVIYKLQPSSGNHELIASTNSAGWTTTSIASNASLDISYLSKNNLLYYVTSNSEKDFYITSSNNWLSSSLVLDSSAGNLYSVTGFSTNSQNKNSILYSFNNVAEFGEISNSSGSWQNPVTVANASINLISYASSINYATTPGAFPQDRIINTTDLAIDSNNNEYFLTRHYTTGSTIASYAVYGKPNNGAWIKGYTNLTDLNNLTSITSSLSIVNTIQSGNDMQIVYLDKTSTPTLKAIKGLNSDFVAFPSSDTTPPVFDNATPSTSNIGANSLSLSTSIDEAGTIYYVVVPNNATAPTSAEVKAGTASGGASALKSGNATVSTGDFSNTFSITGLTASTDYDVYVVADDTVNNLMTLPTKVDVKTLLTGTLLTKVGTESIAFNTGTVGGYNATTGLAGKEIFDNNPIGYNGLGANFNADSFFTYDGKIYGLFLNPNNSFGLTFGRYDGSQIEYFGSQLFDSMNGYTIGNGKIYLNADLMNNGGTKIVEFDVASSTLNVLTSTDTTHDVAIQYYAGNVYYFSNSDYSLSRWNGTAVEKIWNAHASSSTFSNNMVILNNELYFGAEQPTEDAGLVQGKYYAELFKYNASTNTVTQLTDRSSSSPIWYETSMPKNLTVFNDRVFFSGVNSSNTTINDNNDRSLISVNSSGNVITEFQTDSDPNQNGWISGIWNIDNTLYFSARMNNNTYWNLYKYNSTGNSTQLTSFTSANTDIKDAISYNGKVYFTVFDPASSDTGLYQYDGSSVTKVSAFPALTTGSVTENFEAGMEVFQGQLAPVVTNTVDILGVLAGNNKIIASNLTVTDLDSANITGATVTITNGKSTGDSLSFTSANSITGNYDSNTGILTLSGTATASQYESVLRTVLFTAGTTTGQREFRFDVTDSDGNHTWANSPAGKTVIEVVSASGSVTNLDFASDPTAGAGIVGKIEIASSALVKIQIFSEADATVGTPFGLSYDATATAIKILTDYTYPTYLRIQSSNRSEFDLQGFRFNDTELSSILDLKVIGYKDNIQVNQTTVNVNPYGPNTTIVLPTTFNDVDEVTIQLGDNAVTYSSMNAIGGYIDDIVILTTPVGPTVTAENPTAYDDTIAYDTFANITGTISATSSGTITSYGISSGTTGGSTVINSITYDVSKVGTYGTLYVKSSDGSYVYVPDNDKINATLTPQTDTFTLQATDLNGVGGNALNISIGSLLNNQDDETTITHLNNDTTEVALGSSIPFLIDVNSDAVVNDIDNFDSDVLNIQNEELSSDPGGFGDFSFDGIVVKAGSDLASADASITLGENVYVNGIDIGTVAEDGQDASNLHINLSNNATANLLTTLLHHVYYLEDASVTEESQVEYRVYLSNSSTNAASVYFEEKIKPEVTITADKTSLKAGETATITYTFNVEPNTISANNFVASDVTLIGNGTLSDPVVTSDPKIFTATYTPSVNTQSISASISINADKINNSTIKNNASTPLTITGDTLLPTVTSVTSSNNNGYYKINDNINITVNFSENVIVTGTPQLTLETGTTDRTINYSSGLGTNALTFTYTVQSGDYSSDLEYQSTLALALNSGTILDALNNPATLTLPALGLTGSLANSKAIVVDGIAPTDISLSANTLSTSASANTVVGTFSTTDLTPNDSFTYSFETGEGDTDNNSFIIDNNQIKAINPSALTADQKSILVKSVDNAGNSYTKQLFITVTANPTVNITADDTTLKSGQTATVTFTLSESSSDFDVTDVTVTGGGSLTNFNATSGTVYTATYTPPTDTQTLNASIDIGANKFKNATNDLNIAGNLTITGDTLLPTVTSVTSSTNNNSYKTGNQIDVTVNFSENVTVTGIPQITLETGTTDRTINYSSGSDTSALTFTYTVQSGDYSSDLDYLLTSALVLNGGTILDALGNPANLDLPAVGGTGSLANSKDIVIDTTNPTFTTIVRPLLKSPTGTFTIDVTYDDATGSGINSESIDASDITISRPDSLGNLTVSNASWNSSTKTATYTVDKPSDNWTDPRDKGTYTIAIENNQVSDLAGNFVASNANAKIFDVDFNTNPVISNLNNDTVQWAGVGNKVSLDNSTNPNLLAKVSDTENDLSNWDNGSLIIQRYVDLTAMPLSNDIYNIIDGNDYTVSGSMLLKTNLAQDQFASFTNSNGVLTITFGADATSTLISDVINHIQYQNDKPTGDTTIRFTLNDGSGGSTTADVKVESDTIYITNSTDSSIIDVSDGVSFSEAVAIASVDLTGNQTLVLDSTLNTSLTISNVTLAENLTVEANQSSLMNGQISGTGNLTKSGTGTLTLSSFNNYTGNIIISAGTFGIQNESDLTLSNVISGTGNLTKSGTGTLTLSTTPTYSGSTTISDGTLAISSTSDLATSNIILNNGDFKLTNSSDFTLSKVISGTGNFTKSGTGTLTLSGTNGYNGTTIIDQGTLKVASDANLGTDYVQIGGINHSSLEITESGEFDNVIMIADDGDNSSYGTIIINENQTVTLNGKLDEPADKANDLYKSGKGILVLASPDNELGLLGDIFVQEGDVQVADDDSLPNGEIIFDSNGDELDINLTSNTLINNNFSINDNANFNTADGKTITISGEIKGENDSKDFTKKGSGNLNLTGSSSFAGETKITAGLLSVNGSLLNTKDVAVSSGATLGGSGTIGSKGKGAVTISEGGKLAPGNSPGKMTLNNGLTLNAGSTLEIQINNDTVNTSYDQVDVKGFVYLGNSILAITPNANLEIEKSFTIINNDGVDAVVGTFKDASEGALIKFSNKYFKITYKGGDGNDVVLTSTSAPIPPSPYVISINTASTPIVTKAELIDFTVNFSDSVLGVDISDFSLFVSGSLTGSTITGISGSGTFYTISVRTGTGEGTLRLDLNNSNTNIQNSQNISIAGGFSSGQSYTIDKVPPMLSIGTVAIDEKINSSEAKTDVVISGTATGAENGQIVTLNIGGIAKTATVSSNHWTTTLTSADILQLKEGDILIKADVSDLLGNKAIIASKSITYDKILPTISSIERLNPTQELTNNDSLTYKILFSENVENVDATDFSVSGSSATVSNIKNIDQKSYEITVSGGNLANYNGTVGLGLSTSQNIVDAVSNPLDSTKNISLNQSYNLDNNKPTDIKLSDNKISTSDVQNKVVGSLSSTDATQNDTFTYSLVAGQGDNDNQFFKINADNLLAIDPSTLTAGEKSILIRTIDALSHTFDKQLILTVSSINNPPVISSNGGLDQATIELLEGQKEVTTVTATDKDQNDKISYQISGGKNKDLFQIDEISGKLTLKDIIKFNNKLDNNSYEIEVQAIDSQKAVDTQKLSVNIISDMDHDGIANKDDLDMENDGINNAIETQVPSKGNGIGDGNGDEILDSEQNNVASLQASGSLAENLRWATFVIPEGATLSNVKNSPAPIGLPRSVKMPLGKFEFNINNIEKGSSINIDIYTEISANLKSFYKFNYQTKAWVNLGTATKDNDKNKITISLIDGGDYDADREANGVIVDPGGLVEFDEIAPILVLMSPNNNAENVVPSSDLVLNFSEEISKGSGLISLKKASDNSTVEEFDVNSDRVILNQNQITIKPQSVFTDDTKYYVTVSENAILDTALNNFAGISSSSEFAFTTAKTKLSFEVNNAETTTNNSTNEPNNSSSEVKVVASIHPDFTLQTENILKENDKIILLDPNGKAVNNVPVTKEIAESGKLNIPVTETLDDGTYTYTVQIKDESGKVTGESQVNVVVETDRDGIMPSVELSANGGDFNKDGIPDWQQNNVAQLPLMSVEDFEAGKNAPETSFGAIMAGNVGDDGKVVLDSTAQLIDLKVNKLPDVPMPESVKNALTPLLNFSVTADKEKSLKDQDLTRDGIQTKIVIDLPKGVDANSYMKWDEKNQKWFDFTTASTNSDGALLIDSNKDGLIDRIALTFTDGGFGDEDGQENGTIVDPGALTFNKIATTTTPTVPVIVTPTKPVVTTSTKLPIYAIKLANGDRIYTTSLSETATLSKGSSNIFEGSRFDSLKSTDANALPIYKYVNPITQDVFYAKDLASQPYDCYELSSPNPVFYADKTATTTQLHSYLNKAGLTQILSVADGTNLQLLSKGYKDLGVNFTTSTTQSFAFDVEGFLVANKSNAEVQAEVKNLAKSYDNLSNSNAMEEIEQFYFAKANLIGLSNGNSATFADVNSVFGTHFVG